MIPTLFWSTDEIRKTVSAQLDPERRSQLGQFMTPSPIANFMASLFNEIPSRVQLLDPGAGIGSLSEAFAKRYFSESRDGKLSITTCEIDDLLSEYLDANLKNIVADGNRSGTEVFVELKDDDFVMRAVSMIRNGERPFTHAILNPPYKKLAADSTHRTALSGIGIEASNLYAAFLALTVSLIEENGEVVAIIPRSFCNGPYFRHFRHWLLDRVAIQHIHIFESRNKAFGEDGVLQENVILHLARSAPQGQVTISTSTDATFSDHNTRSVEFTEIVNPNDKDKFIRIPTSTESFDHFSLTLSDLELEVATGPVVDFRVKEHCLEKPQRASVPLLYAHHFSHEGVMWPRDHKKPNAIRITPNTQKLLMPKGWYVVVKRFSAKEEPRRVVAYLVDPNQLPHEQYGFENHLNVFHFKRQGLEPEIARGLTIYLNSSIVDSYFRTFSGHTQVNATDLKSMYFPSGSILKSLGKAIPRKQVLSQEEIDTIVESYAEKK